MRMATLTIDRRLLYNKQLTLPERVLLAIVEAAGEDGFMFGTRYLSRAMNVTAHRVEVILNILIKNQYLIDTSNYSNPGVMALRVLYLGPKTAEILSSRAIDSGGTDVEYIPSVNLDELVEDYKK